MLWGKYKQRGFTIVELLIVIVVIAILAAITIVAYNGIQDRARSSAVASLLSQVSTSLQSQKALNEDMLPSTLDGLVPSSTPASAFEYWIFNGARDYCLATADNKGAYYYIRSDKQGPPTPGRCSQIDWVAGAPLAFNSAAGTTTSLSSPLSGAPDITLYVVVTINDASVSWRQYAGLTPNTTNNRFAFQSSIAGDTGSGYRIDSPATSNASDAQPSVRTPGVHIGWMQVSNNASTRSFGYDKAASHNSANFMPGSGWGFTGLFVDSVPTSYSTQSAVVYNAAHDEGTRRSIMNWLAKKYNTGQTF